MYEVVAIMGKAGAGKDTLLQEILRQTWWLHEIVSCTTRPMREGEKDGVNYHFLTNQEFADRVADGRMFEAVVFNDWCYGTSEEGLSDRFVNIGVFNPEGIDILSENPKVNLHTIYVKADDKIRLIRQLNREVHPDVSEIVRRFGADEKDFAHINEDEIDLIVDNTYPPIQQLAEKIIKIFEPLQQMVV